MSFCANHFFKFFLILFIFSTVEAKILYWPEFCESGTLKITNTGPQSAPVWLQKFSPLLESETEYFLNSNSVVNIKIEKTKQTDRFSLMHNFQNKNLKSTYECGQNSYETTEIDGGKLTFKRSLSHHHKLWLQNIYSDNNEVLLEYLDANHQKIFNQNFVLKSSEAKSYLISEDIAWAYLRLHSTNKLVSFLINEKTTDAALKTEFLETKIDEKAHYFLLSPRNSEVDSFVVKITNETLVQKARELIKNPNSEKMLFATIQKGHQGFNRNYSNPTHNQWSWSTVEVTSFADFGSTACNGHPQAVEDRIDSWVNNPGRICFWDYRVKKELTATEVSLGN